MNRGRIWRALQRIGEVVAPATKPGPPEPKFGTKKVLGLMGLGIAAMTASIDQRIGAVAQRDLVGGLGFDIDDGSWLYTAYLVGFVGIVPFTPWLAKMLSPRRVATVMAICAPVFAMLVPDMPSYRGVMMMRCLQGFSEGGLTPLYLITVLQIVPKRRRPEGFATYVLATTLVPLVTYSLAGLATDIITWQTAFYVSAPLAPVAVALIYGFLPYQPVKWAEIAGTDFFSMFALFACATMLAVGLDQGQRLDWFDNGLVTSMFAGSVFFLAVFVINDLLSPRPLINLGVLGKRDFAVGMMLIVLFDLVILGPSFLLAGEQMMIRALKPLQIGNVLLRLLVVQAVMTPVAVLLLKRIDARLLVGTGFALIGLGLYLDAYVTTPWDGNNFMNSIVIQSAAWPLTFTPMVYLTTHVLQREDGVSGGTLFNTTRNLATGAATVIPNAIVTVRERVHSNIEIQHVVPGQWNTDERIMIQGVDGVAGAVREGATVQAYADAFGWSAFFCLVAIGLVLLEKEAPLIKSKVG